MHDARYAMRGTFQFLATHPASRIPHHSFSTKILAKFNAFLTTLIRRK
jgi:hypothetical protein